MAKWMRALNLVLSCVRAIALFSPQHQVSHLLTLERVTEALLHLLMGGEVGRWTVREASEATGRLARETSSCDDRRAMGGDEWKEGRQREGDGKEEDEQIQNAEACTRDVESDMMPAGIWTAFDTWSENVSEQVSGGPPEDKQMEDLFAVYEEEEEEQEEEEDEKSVEGEQEGYIETDSLKRCQRVLAQSTAHWSGADRSVLPGCSECELILSIALKQHRALLVAGGVSLWVQLAVALLERWVQK